MTGERLRVRQDERLSGAPVPSSSWRAAFLVFMFAGGLLTACVASPGPSEPTLPATEPPASTGVPEGTQPPFNRVEVKVIDALARLGVRGQRAELPAEGASIWAEPRPGVQFFVNAGPTATRRGEFTVIDERELEGIRVVRVKYGSDLSLRHRFECAGDTYELRGAVPPGFDDVEAFTAAFIKALGCTG